MVRALGTVYVAIQGVIVAMTTWNGRISPVLDVARQAELFKVSGGQARVDRTVVLPGTEPEPQADALQALGAQVLICGALSRPLAMLLSAAGLNLLPFTAGETGEVLAAWLAGNLPNPVMTMPGCGGRRLGWCRGRRRGGRDGYRRTP